MRGWVWVQSGRAIPFFGIKIPPFHNSLSEFPGAMLGLKENVIIGKLIPAGSGLTQYRKADAIDENGNLIVPAAAAPEAQETEESEVELELEETEELIGLELETEGSDEEIVGIELV